MKNTESDKPTSGFAVEDFDAPVLPLDLDGVSLEGLEGTVLGEAINHVRDESKNKFIVTAHTSHSSFGNSF